MQRKQTAVFASSLLGLTLAVTGCSTANSQTIDPANRMVQHNGDRPMGEKMHHRGDKMKGGMMGHGMGGMTELNLSDAQKAQLKTLREQNQAKMQQLHATLKQYDDNIAAQKKAGASTASLLSLYQQKQAVMQQFFTLRQQQEQQFMSVLTPEQQLKFYESRGKGMHDGMKKGGMKHGERGMDGQAGMPPR